MALKRYNNKTEQSVIDNQNLPIANATAKGSAKLKWQKGKISVLLAIITVIAYSGIFSNDFINYDDNRYVIKNIHVQQGLSCNGIVWAFTAFYECNWHPITWLSHMLDVQLFGLNPAGHHFTNLLLHILATLLLFGFLSYATGRLWVCALVTALFALHPVHVESVAWVAERKDVLSAVFWFASLWAYSYYARRPAIGRYMLVLFLYALGLLAKPMLVSLPLVLLLLDYWPLNRLTKNCSIARLFVEKLPLFIIAGVSSIITIIAQHQAVGDLVNFSLTARISNAIVSYCVYMGQLFWPIKLSIYYPYTFTNAINITIYALLLITITVIIVWMCRGKIYLLSGWLWYIVTLIPVIGIVQVGGQAHADRYTYIPFVGLFIIISWGLNDIAAFWGRRNKTFLTIASIAILLALATQTWKQVGYWKNDLTLFSHADAVTKNNVLAYRKLCDYFDKTGRTEDAVAQYKKLLEICPDNDTAHFRLGCLLSQAGRNDEAITHLKMALNINPNHAEAHYNLGNILLHAGRTEEAIVHYKKGLKINPDKIEALCNLAGAYYKVNQLTEAVPLMQKALSLSMAAKDSSMVKDILDNIELLNKKMSTKQEAQ
jgi:Tfp pilus assembly protein PilF